MKDHRHGEHLWMEWTGEGYTPSTSAEIVFYAEEIVNINIPLIQKALASALQREGIVDSLSDGYNLISKGTAVHGYFGYVGGDIIPTACSVLGITEYGEKLEAFNSCTWIELPEF